MESQPRNPEFRINPENFHQCIQKTGGGGGGPVPPPSRSVHAAQCIYTAEKKRCKTKI